MSDQPPELLSRAVLPDEIDEDPVPPPHGWPEYADAINETDKLRARVAELEAENAGLSTEIRQVEGLKGKPDGWLRWHREAMAERDRAQEGERRKQEECLRLEGLLSLAHAEKRGLAASLESWRTLAANASREADWARRRERKRQSR